MSNRCMYNAEGTYSCNMKNIEPFKGNGVKQTKPPACQTCSLALPCPTYSLALPCPTGVPCTNKRCPNKKCPTAPACQTCKLCNTKMDTKMYIVSPPVKDVPSQFTFKTGKYINDSIIIMNNTPTYKYKTTLNITDVYITLYPSLTLSISNIHSNLPNREIIINEINSNINVLINTFTYQLFMKQGNGELQLSEPFQLDTNSDKIHIPVNVILQGSGTYSYFIRLFINSTNDMDRDTVIKYIENYNIGIIMSVMALAPPDPACLQCPVCPDAPLCPEAPKCPEVPYTPEYITFMQNNLLGETTFQKVSISPDGQPLLESTGLLYNSSYNISTLVAKPESTVPTKFLLSNKEATIIMNNTPSYKNSKYTILTRLSLNLDTQKFQSTDLVPGKEKMVSLDYINKNNNAEEFFKRIKYQIFIRISGFSSNGIAKYLDIPLHDILFELNGQNKSIGLTMRISIPPDTEYSYLMKIYVEEPGLLEYFTSCVIGLRMGIEGYFNKTDNIKQYS